MDNLNKRSFQQRQAPEWANFVARHNGNWYWEESLRQENGKRFQNIKSENGITPPRYSNATSKGWDKAYRLPGLAVAPAPYVDTSKDDELPPAPTNELYVSNTGRRTASIRLELTSISIGTDASPRRVRVSVETARAMAHDLIRMAAELERQEKADESGE